MAKLEFSGVVVDELTQRSEASEKGTPITEVPAPSSPDDAPAPDNTQRNGPVAPWTWKLGAVLVISCISFGSSWSDGITGAMKSTIKKELGINNTEYALLETSEDLMVTVLILASGFVTDRIGGANAIVYGNVIYSIGSTLVAAAAQVRSFRFMVGGRVVLAVGDIATQVAQYKVFSSWFPPNNGFASTLGVELAIKKLGGFVGKASANPIAVNTGNFAWVFWIAVFMMRTAFFSASWPVLLTTSQNLFTNIMTVGFYYFNKIGFRKFRSVADPSTGEQLTEKSKKFEPRKVLELPWVFWCVMAFSLFETSTAIVFSANATEFAEQRFGTDSITSGWFSSVLQYAGFFVVPCLGLFIDMYGNRVCLLAFCGFGVFVSMLLVNFATTTKGTAAAFGIYAFAYSFGPTSIIDSIRTSMWHQSVFGTAYAMKIHMNNAMNIVVRIIAAVIQDADDNSYDRVTILYVILAGCSLSVSLLLIPLAWKSLDLGNLQWTRKQRMVRGDLWNERKQRFHGENGPRNRLVSKACFGFLMLLTFGAWSAYIWGAVTGHNDS